MKDLEKGCPPIARGTNAQKRLEHLGCHEYLVLFKDRNKGIREKGIREKGNRKEKEKRKEESC